VATQALRASAAANATGTDHTRRGVALFLIIQRAIAIEIGKRCHEHDWEVDDERVQWYA